MQIDEFPALLKAAQNAKILIVGDIMLDRFIYGGVERISPESPVPILNVKREDMMLGGAGNALANLKSLGAHGVIVSVIGDDTDGQAISALIKDAGGDTRGLIIDKDRPTIVKTRFLAGHQQLLRADFEGSAALSNAVAEKVLSTAIELLTDMDVLILSDYGKGLLRGAGVSALIKAANERDIPVIVDPKGADFSLYKGASIITPNKKELHEATNMAVDTDEAVVAAGQHILKTCGIEAVVATRSADGMSVIRRDQTPVHFPSADIEVFDVSGAGDTVIATLGAMLAGGANLQDAAHIANIAGGIVVTKVGTAPIRADELHDHFMVNTSRHAALMSDEQALDQVKRWRAKGLKVGFTNGCFDILHFGHVSYLNDTRACCDRLIVALNTDASVRVLKGESRPVHDELSRAAVLGSMVAVDMVVLFGADDAKGDNTANEILKILKPDIYFKGGDYTIDQIPEAPIVQDYGGTVKIMASFDGHSTTNSIKKINA